MTELQKLKNNDSDHSDDHVEESTIEENNPDTLTTLVSIACQTLPEVKLKGIQMQLNMKDQSKFE